MLFDTNAAVGDGVDFVAVMYPVLAMVSLPALFVAVRVTVYVPALVYSCEGFCEEELPPSPKDHTHDVGEFVEVSMNWIPHGIVPDVALTIKDATGVELAETGLMIDKQTQKRKKHADGIVLIAYPPDFWHIQDLFWKRSPIQQFS